MGGLINLIKKHMKKILTSLAIIAIVGALGFGATQAFFSDTKLSSGNTFTAGELNLELRAGDEQATATNTLFTETNMMPGVSVGPATLHFKNISSVSGKVKINISYTTADNTTNDIDVNDNNFARNLRLVSGISDTTEVREYWAGHIIKYAYSDNPTNALADMAIYEVSAGVYAPTVYGLSKIPFYFDAGAGDGSDAYEWLANATHDVSFTLQLNPAANNDYQNDGISVTLTATMVQWGGSF